MSVDTAPVFYHCTLLANCLFVCRYSPSLLPLYVVGKLSICLSIQPQSSTTVRCQQTVYLSVDTAPVFYHCTLSANCLFVCRYSPSLLPLYVVSKLSFCLSIQPQSSTTVRCQQTVYLSVDTAPVFYHCTLLANCLFVCRYSPSLLPLYFVSELSICLSIQPQSSTTVRCQQTVYLSVDTAPVFYHCTLSANCLFVCRYSPSLLPLYVVSKLSFCLSIQPQSSTTVRCQQTVYLSVDTAPVFYHCTLSANCLFVCRYSPSLLPLYVVSKLSICLSIQPQSSTTVRCQQTVYLSVDTAPVFYHCTLSANCLFVC